MWGDERRISSGKICPGGEDTIVAVATPPGRGAIAVIRLSGQQAHLIARQHVQRWPSVVRRATLCTIVDAQGVVLDRALVTVFAGPDSFTGEDLVEISTHGGGIVPALVLAAFIRSGARQALPGEFTRRAVLNGKLDVMQAEAMGDLISATSRAMHAAAIHQLEGGLSQRITTLREMLVGVEATIAYDIDFPEEDDGPISRDQITSTVGELLLALNRLLTTASAGELIRSGAVVVIAGAPNVGKSSLFNAILGVQRAIVTHIPGTTRDAIEAMIEVGSWPVRLVDTAGLRETDDIVERVGIGVSARYLAMADVVLACSDTDREVGEAALTIQAMTQAPVIGVRTKLDIGASSAAIGVSAVTGEGISDMLSAVTKAIENRYGPLLVDIPVLTRGRHQYAVETARNEVAAFDLAWREASLPASVAAVHLRAAARALEELIGAIDIEDVLDRLFGTFCVGK